eukprot:10802168-Heterocapsa_arctica.AAC.1
MQKTIANILDCNKLKPSEAGRLAGKAGFLSTTTHGRVGPAATRPLYVRQHSVLPSHGLTVALRSSLSALSALLTCCPPRRIPLEAG